MVTDRLTRARSGFNWPLAGWLLCALVTVGLLIALVPIHLGRVLQDPQVQGGYLALRPAFSLRSFGNLVLALRYAGLLVFLAVAGLIVWRRPSDRLSLIVAVMLVTMPLMSQLGGFSDTWMVYPKAWRPVLNGAYQFVTFGVGMPAMLAFLFLFPTGRAEPRWLGWVGGGLTVALYTVVFVASWLPVLYAADRVFNWLLAGFLVMLALALFGQAYRYVRVSSPTERRQTGLVVLGVFIFIFGLLAQLLIGFASDQRLPDPWVSLATIGLSLLTLLALPVSIAVAILRYRLWDIDVIVRRTLVYAVLTGLLALIYFGAVVLLEAGVRPLTGQSENPIVSVLSTLAIAALFGPLRRRVQTFIDRRFYRRKYDAACIIAAFGDALRDETALDQVTAKLASVAAATVQPSHASVWLPPAPRPTPPRAPGDDR